MATENSHIRRELLFLPVAISAVCLLTYVFLSILKQRSAYVPSLFFTLALLGLLEWIAPRRPVRYERKKLIVDTFCIVMNPLIVAALGYAIVEPMRPNGVGFLPWIQSLRLPVQVTVLFLLTEFFRYWAHRFQHELPRLWKFHAVHHSMKEIYFYNQFLSHPVDYFLRNSLTFAIMFLFAFSLEAFAYSQAIATVVGMVTHANFTIRSGFWNVFFPTSEVHRWHHSTDPRESDCNYGIACLLWDHVFGTYRRFDLASEPNTYGIEDSRYGADDLKKVILAPFSS